VITRGGISCYNALTNPELRYARAYAGYITSHLMAK
jgi:hypothetical protein